jgi:hypothetical protein
MSDEPYLIAHKVRGEAAFDIAIRIECPMCNPNWSERVHGCHECDSLGYWWIIPTSGHRAYPYWNAKLEDIDDTYELDLRGVDTTYCDGPPPMPDHCVDHYPDHGTAPKVDLATALGIRPKTQPKIDRRI